MLDENEVDAICLPAGWRENLEGVMKSIPSPLPDELWLTYNIDLLKILETIGRPDLAVAHLSAEMRILAEYPVQQPRLDQSLMWLGPFAHDLCYLISFEMSATQGWKLRKTSNYPEYLDFLHAFGEDGEPVEQGELLKPSGARTPYSMTSPQEDCSTTLVPYGVINRNPVRGWVYGTETPEVKAAIVEPFETWVKEAVTRIEPPPSARPYLKLLFQEWFMQAFATLQLGTAPGDFIYEPVAASVLSEREIAAELLGSQLLDAGDRRLLHRFDELHVLLNDLYGR